MAEKIVLFDLSIDIDAVNKDSAELSKSIKTLKEEIKALANSEEDQGEAVEQLTAQLKLEQKQLAENRKQTQNVIKTNKESKGSINALRAELAVTTTEWAKLSKEERTNTDRGKALVAQKKKLTDELKKEEKATGDTRRNVGNYTEGIQGAFGATSQLIPGVGKASSAMQLFGTATKVALGPLGLLIAAGFALKAFFESSEEGQAALNKVMAVFGVVIGNLTDVVANFGEGLFEAITNPKEALDSLVQFVEDRLVTSFEGLLELFPKLGKAISLLFQGEFALAAETAGDAVAKVAFGVEDFTDKVVDGFNAATDAVKEFAEETEKEARQAARLADLKLATDRLERKALVERAKAEQQIAELRLKSRKEDEFSAAERLKFLEEAGVLQDGLIIKDETIAKNRLKLRVIENSFSKSTKENLDEQAQLEAKVSQVQIARLNQARQLERELNTLRKQARSQDLKEERAAAVESLKILKERVAAEKAFLDQEKERRATNDLNELALQEQNIFNQIAVEREGLEAKRQQELEFARKIGADVSLVNRKFDAADLELEGAKLDAKLALGQQFAGNIATIFGEQTAVGRAAAVAETAINTYRSATAAYASLSGIPVVGVGLGIAAAAAAVAAGLANVKKILSIKSGLPGDSGGGAAVPSGGGVPASTPEGPGTAPTINQGIVSRDTLLRFPRAPVKETAVIIDEVTAAQNGQSSNNKTAVT